MDLGCKRRIVYNKICKTYLNVQNIIINYKVEIHQHHANQTKMDTVSYCKSCRKYLR